MVAPGRLAVKCEPTRLDSSPEGTQRMPRAHILRECTKAYLEIAFDSSKRFRPECIQFATTMIKEVVKPLEEHILVVREEAGVRIQEPLGVINVTEHGWVTWLLSVINENSEIIERELDRPARSHMPEIKGSIKLTFQGNPIEVANYAIVNGVRISINDQETVFLEWESRDAYGAMIGLMQEYPTDTRHPMSSPKLDLVHVGCMVDISGMNIRINGIAINGF